MLPGDERKTRSGGLMTKEQLISKVAAEANISEDEAQVIINAFTDQIKEQLIRGEKVTISGFGTFVLSHRKARTFVNPKTGEKHELPERKLPHFKAGAEFKKSIRT